MSSKNFSIRLDNGQASASVNLILPTTVTEIAVPVYVQSPPVIQPPPPKRPRSIEFTSSGGFLSTISYWTVPNGVTSLTVTAIGGGAGGSSGSEGDPYVSGGGGGGSGGFVKRTISVQPGQTLGYRVGSGGAGAPRTSGGAVRIGTAGTDTYFHTIVARGGEPATSNYTKSHYQVGGVAGAGGQNGRDGEIVRSSTDGNSVLCSGGAGGGVPGFSTGGIGGQVPKTISFSVNSRQLPNSQPVTFPAWNSTMNQYAVWGPTLASQNFDSSTTTYFPFTGDYTFFIQADNSGSVLIDGSTIISARDNFNAAPVSITRRITEGNHVIRVTGSNAGAYSPGSNPAGVAVLITGTGRSALVNDGNGFNGSGYGAGGGGGFGQSGGSPPQGGGGNGIGGYIKLEWEE